MLKLVILLLSIILLFMILYKSIFSVKYHSVMNERIENKSIIPSTSPIVEGLYGIGENTAYSEVTQIQKMQTNVVGIKNAQNTELPISQYVIKASYNTARSGNYVSIDMIKQVLSRGCRFMDFEVFSINNNPMVAFSTDPTYQSIDSLNSIPLGDVLKIVGTYAFMEPSPNTADPLFINLRIKSNQPSIYSAIAISIQNNIPNNRYSGFVNKETPLSKLMGKIVIIVDKTLARDYKTLNVCPSGKNDGSCPTLASVINMESGGEALRISKYSDILNQCTSPPFIMDDGANADVNFMRYIIPDNGNNKNPSYIPFIRDYAAQVIAYGFYNNDAELISYEELFRHNKTAFVSMADSMRTITGGTNG